MEIGCNQIVIYLHKLVPYLLYPSTFILGMMVWACFGKNRKPIWIALVVFWCCSTPYVSDTLVKYLEKDQIRKDISDIRPADVVVVLGGSLLRVQSASGPIYEWTDPDRYFAGIELIKANKAKYLFFTSGKLPWNSLVKFNNSPITEGQYQAKLAQTYGIEPRRIKVSDEVENTAQEARAVKAFLSEQGLQSVILVTSSFHMTRARQIFLQEGIVVESYPVDSKVELSELTPMDFLPDARAFAQTQFAWRELMGRLFYQMKTIL